MPLSRMENTNFAMSSIIDSHDMGLRTVYSPDAQKKTPIQLLLRNKNDKLGNLIEKAATNATSVLKPFAFPSILTIELVLPCILEKWN
ncbi:hypothetical protein TNCV_369791 [Trichonephila clavipes]|nr:hypothetical protein TNCV_369791 [Trichonephila clavipes]